MGVVGVGTLIGGFLVVVTGAPASAEPAVPSGPGSVWVVNASGNPPSSSPSSSCTSPSENTIQAAVNDASPGDTVYVCPGTYDESVSISKSDLTLDGAEYGVAVSSTSPRSGPESIVDGGSGPGITYTGGPLTGETVSGLTFNNSASLDDQREILAANVGTAWTFTDNIMDVSNGGIYFNTNDALSPGTTTIKGNEFTQSVGSEAGSGWYGQAIIIWTHSGVNVNISANDFYDLSGPGADVQTTGAGASSDCATDPSTGLSVASNTAEVNGTNYDDNLVVLFCSSSASITGNTFTVTDSNDPNAVTPIYLGGGDISAVVSGNTLNGNGATVPGGAIGVGTPFYPTESNALIENNSITGWGDNGTDGQGIVVYGDSSGFTIEGNTLTDNGYGIWVTPNFGGTPSGSVINNTISGSTTDDCKDETSGGLTSGTADTWTGDVGVTSSPAGLCQSPDTVTSSPTNPSITLGQADNDLATVSGNAADNSPTGSVSFYQCGPTALATPCLSQTVPVGSAVTLSPGSGNTATATSQAFTPSATGFWCFAAVYSGSSNYLGGQDTTTNECVDVTLATASSVTSPTNPTINLGLSNTDKATVSGNATGGSPTGTVSFFECGPNPGSLGCSPGATAVGGPVSLSPAGGNTSTATSPAFTPTSAGTWCFAVAYSGDTNYAPGFQGGPSECFTVAQIPTSTGTVPTNSTIAVGGSDTDTATVNGTAIGGSPTGSVSFYQCGPTPTATACTSTAHQVGSAVPLTAEAGNKATATSAPFTPTAPGFWCFAGIYSGNTNYSPSGDTTSDECVMVTKATASVQTTPASSTVVVGSSNTDQIAVTGNAAAGSPTGTISFYRCGPTTVPTACTSTANLVGSTGLTPGAGNVSTATSPSFTATSTGYWCFAGVYSGDGNYNSGSDTSVDECYDVTKASTTTTTAPAISTIILGASDTDGATVKGAAIPGRPTGTVTFYDCGPTPTATSCTDTSHLVGSPVPVTAGVGATSTATSGSFTPTSTGFWCFAGVYSGDGNYKTSSDTTVDECVDVTPATTGTVTAPTSPTLVLGGTDTDGVTVTGNAAGGSPTGTVSFYECGPTAAAAACTSTAHPVGTAVTLTPGIGNASTATSPAFMPTSTGYWCFAGVYSGDGNYQTSADTTVDECFHVTASITSTTTLPTNTTITFGQADTDLATVAGNAAGGSPTGTVSFYECGPSAAATPCASSTNKVGGPVALTAGPGNTSTATSASFTPAAIGYTCFMGVYSGDGNYFGSSDTTTEECVNVVSSGATVTTSTPTTATIVLGGTDSDGATVTGNAAGGSPTGSVTFYACGPTPVATPCTSTAHPVGSAVGLTAGPGNTATAASTSFKPTAAGVWCFAADYSGGASYFASADGSTDECFNVTPAATTTVTAPTSATVLLGATNTDSVAVTGNATGGSPAGTVSFYACGPLATPAPCTSIANPVGAPVHLTLGAGNASSATSPAFTPAGTGTWCFAGLYSGSSNYLASSDSTTDECFQVTAGSSVTTSAPAQATIVTGSSNSDVATVAGNAAGGSPTGTVSFYECGPTAVATACTSTANPLGGAVPLTAGSGNTATAASGSFTPNATGFWCFASRYSGSAKYLASNDETTGECFDVETTPTGLTILTTSLPSGTKGSSYSFTLSAAGGLKPYKWHASRVAPGLTLNKLTGVISGIPIGIGTYTVPIQVTDATKPHEKATVKLKLTIAP